MLQFNTAKLKMEEIELISNKKKEILEKTYQ